MFYAALALLQKISKAPSKHSGVITLFDTEFVKKGIFDKELSKDFHKAFEIRQKTDYKILEPVSLDGAKEVYTKANHFVQAVWKHLSLK
jgi:uncharacterized protein (UPF0332 family)